MVGMLHENGGAGFLASELAVQLAKAPDADLVKRQDQRLQERLYLDFMPVRRWLKVTTSARALAAAGVM